MSNRDFCDILKYIKFFAAVPQRGWQQVSGADIRIRELVSKVRQIHFPELKGGNVTISVGVCFAPEHGTCYMDLYKNADIALYETKQAGRDGYRMYQKE